MVVRKSKKSQVLVFSAMFLILLIIFIYSLENQNSYKPDFRKSTILENIKFETCQVGKMSNGSYLDSRFVSFSQNVSNYCTYFDNSCTLTITKEGGAPTNLSLLNYTHYSYSIDFTWDNFTFSGGFSC